MLDNLQLIPIVANRFNLPFKEYRWQAKHEHRNELVFLLDELLRQDGITRDEYSQLNNMLAESLDEEDESTKDETESTTMEEDEGKLKKLIRSTVEYLIQHDKKEVLELIRGFRKEVDEDVLDTVYDLEELVVVYLLDEFIGSESVLPKIDELGRKLDGSTILKSKQHRLHILLKDINQNRYRVETILKRLADAAGEEAFALKQLALEELLSEEQHLELDKALLEHELDSSRIVDIIKGTKVGQGLKFLLRKLNDLVKSLQGLLEELGETGKTKVRKVAAVLEELLSCNGISLDRYSAIKEDNSIS